MADKNKNIVATDLHNYNVSVSYAQEITSGGVDKKMVRLVFDQIDLKTIMDGFAKAELLRKTQAMFRTSTKIAKIVNDSATPEHPYVVKASQFSTKKQAVDVKALVAHLKGTGLTPEQIVAKLLEDADEDTE